MLGRRENLCGGSQFDDLAGVKDEDTISEAVEKKRVVRDKEYRDAQSDLDLAEEFENFALRRGIERGGGFVGDE